MKLTTTILDLRTKSALTSKTTKESGGIGHVPYFRICSPPISQHLLVIRQMQDIFMILNKGIVSCIKLAHPSHREMFGGDYVEMSTASDAVETDMGCAKYYFLVLETFVI